MTKLAMLLLALPLQAGASATAPDPLLDRNDGLVDSFAVRTGSLQIARRPVRPP